MVFTTTDGNKNVITVSLSDVINGIQSTVSTKGDLTTVTNLASNLATNYYDKATIDAHIAIGNTDQANASTVSALSDSLASNYYTKTQSDSSLTAFSNLYGSVTSLVSGISSNSIIGTNQLINYYTKENIDGQLNLKMNLSGGDFSNSVGFLGDSYIQLGKDATRQSDAGRIAYQSYSTGLDIVGGGTLICSRLTKIYDNLAVPFSLSVGNTSPTLIDSTGICIPQGKALSFSHGSQLINIGYGSITGSELYRLRGVTFPFQDQLDGKMNMLGDVFEVTSVTNLRGQTNTIGLLNVVGDLNLQSNLKVYVNSIITPLNLSYLENLGQNVESSLNTKAGSTTVNSQLALKADLSYVNTQLSTCLKVSNGGYDITGPAEFYKQVFVDDTVLISGVTNLNGGVNVNSNIAAGGVIVSPTTFSYIGSSTSNLQSQINTKANTITINSQLALKADCITVNSQLALKADATYVDAAVNPCLKVVGGGYNITGPAEFYQQTFFDDVVFLSGVTNINGGVNLNANIATGGVSISPTELSYLASSTSNLQTQTNNKASLTGASSIGPVKLTGTNFIELGQGTTKQGNAGFLGYQRYSTGLDIVGAGLSVGSRLVDLWDNLNVEGSASFKTAFVGGNAVVVTTDTRLTSLQGNLDLMADLTYVDAQLLTKATTTQVSSLASSGGAVTMITLNSRFPAPFCA